jgi:thiosulfate/3-mercaptopyruvate sulfurtransferase
MTTTRLQNPPDARRDEVLVEPAWLLEHLRDPDVRLVEVDVNATAYDSGHLEGAVLWNVYTDLKDADYGTIDGTAFQELVRRSGIAPDSTVVLYGYAPAMGLWLLRSFGHCAARVLNCSRDEWVAAGGNLTAASSAPPPSGYVLRAQDPRIRADLAAVHAAIDEPTVTIADVRSEAEFRGDAFWPSGAAQPGGRAGHVPTAVHVPVDAVLDERGRYRDAAALRQIFAAVDPAGDTPVITYCAIGGRASTAWFVLTDLLGRSGVAVYDGSWAEWGRAAGTPVSGR